MSRQCEIDGCPMHVCAEGIPNQKISDERAYLCAGHAYALVMYVENGIERLSSWLETWTRPVDPTRIRTFLNSCRLIAEGHREELLKWRRENPAVRNAAWKN